MSRKTVILLALVLVFALIFTACAARRPLQTPVQPGNTGLNTGNRGTYTGIAPYTTNPYDPRGDATGNPTYYGGYGGYGGYNNGMYGGYGNDYRNIGGGNNSPNYGLGNTVGTTVADRLARICEGVPGVDNATCVVVGDTAYVGVDTDGDLTGRNIAYGTASDLTSVKSQCAQKIRAANPQIKTVYVSTDANFFERLRRVRDGVRNGNPIDSFRNELNDLIRGLTPERQ